MHLVLAAVTLLAGVSCQNLRILNNFYRQTANPVLMRNPNGITTNQLSIPFTYAIPSGSVFDTSLEERVLGDSFNPTRNPFTASVARQRDLLDESALGATLNPSQIRFVPYNQEMALGDSINRNRAFNSEMALGASINYLSGYQPFANGLIRPYSPLSNFRTGMPIFRRYLPNEGILGASISQASGLQEAALGASTLPIVSTRNVRSRGSMFSYPFEQILGDQTSLLNQNGWMRQAFPSYINPQLREQILGDSLTLNSNQQEQVLGDSFNRNEEVLGSWTWPLYPQGQNYGRRLHGYKRRAKY